MRLLLFGNFSQTVLTSALERFSTLHPSSAWGAGVTPQSTTVPGQSGCRPSSGHQLQPCSRINPSSLAHLCRLNVNFAPSSPRSWVAWLMRRTSAYVFFVPWDYSFTDIEKEIILPAADAESPRTSFVCVTSWLSWSQSNIFLNVAHGPVWDLPWHIYSGNWLLGFYCRPSRSPSPVLRRQSF